MSFQDPKPYKLNTDRTAAVSTDTYWIPVDEHTPIGVKVLLICKKYGVATTGTYYRESQFTHWHPLPRFRKDEECKITK